MLHYTKSTQERNKNKSIQIGHETINKVTHIQFIGIIIDEMLDWHRHKTKYLEEYMQ